MKYFLVLALFGAAAIAASIPEIDRVHGENGWYIPRIDGTFEWVDLDEAESYLENRSSYVSPPIRSHHEEHREIKLNKKSIEEAHFNAKHPTRITIHGWTNSKDDYVNTGIREAFLSHGDYNMIVVDWGRARSVDYASSVLAIPGVGKKVAELVDFLVKEFHMKLDTLEIIGHSLGAHVAGYTGKNIKSGKAHAIIGLDPALPFTDAHYVESIQTNGGKLGFLKPIGKGAFYPNGGKKQPGCGADVTGSCSHGRAVIYYVEAIERDNFASIKCGDYEEAVDKKCGSSYSSTRMGAITNAYMVEGDFYVPVNKEAPFELLPPSLSNHHQFCACGYSSEERINGEMVVYNRNEPQEITISVQSIRASNFNASNPTRITIHGWTRSKEDYVNWGVRNALLAYGDYNMIAIDWARARSIDYISSFAAVPGVGETIAEMVNLLNEECGLNLDDLEIIGHSLGAHVAGYTGKNIKSGKAHAIIGLDPALPMYSYNEPDKRLSSTDANYVESIQTNGGKLGFLKPIGKGAFYPNGGKWQPGCGLDLTGNCSHVRSVIYYKEAIEFDNFATFKCSNYEDAVANNCDENYSGVRMGAIENAYMVAGNYNVPVRDEAPFASGCLSAYFHQSF
ncbi:hypothetical protein DOY81_012071 [Sarcophaga bullata]|nr:hypothetical protein DOY81_012071 [Sarcophaga bullata]